MASINDFVKNSDDFVAKWLSQQGLQKLVDVFKCIYCLFFYTLLLFLVQAACLLKIMPTDF